MLSTLWSFAHQFMALGIAGLCIAGGVAAWIYVPLAGRVLGALLFCCGAAAGGYDRGIASASSASQEAALTQKIAARDAKIAELERQAKAGAADLAAATARQAEAETKAATAEESIDAYRVELAKAKDSACALSDADLRRLRGLTWHPRPGRHAPGAPASPP